jgi:hypothetical protein
MTGPEAGIFFRSSGEIRDSIFNSRRTSVWRGRSLRAVSYSAESWSIFSSREMSGLEGNEEKGTRSHYSQKPQIKMNVVLRFGCSGRFGGRRLLK